jgi:uncharacterized protein
MKKLIIFAVILSSVFLFALPLSAAGTTTPTHPPRVVDDAGLLSDSDEVTLKATLVSVSLEHDCDVIVVTVNSTGGKSVQAYADDYYDQNGYGLGTEKSGILLLVSMGEHDWYISTAGAAIKIFPYNTLGVIGDQVAGYLSDANYSGAFDKFADLADGYLTSYKNGGSNNNGGIVDNGGSYNNGGSSYNNNDNYSTQDVVMTYLSPILLAFFIAALIALVVVLVMKSSLKSVRHKLTAHDYVRGGSMRVTNASEFFLFRTVSRVARPQNPPPSSGSHGGGASFGGVHTSSSGASHGGRGGKF